MGKSIKLDNETYIDAGGVMMHSASPTHRKTLGDWSSGLVDTQLYAITRGGSISLTLSTYVRAILFTESIGQNANGIYYLYVNNSTAASKPYVDAAAITFSSNGNVLTITNTRTDVTVYVSILVANGTISEA